MRNPSISAAVLCIALASAAAAAGGAGRRAPAPDPNAFPTWQVQEEPFSSWRVVNFTDGSGKSRELWCRFSECDWNKKRGTARLYVFDRQSDESYDYQPHWWSSTTKSQKTTYSTLVSGYVLELSSNKAVVPGTNQAYAVEDRPQMTPTGYILRVLPPKAAANDVPAPVAPPVPPTIPPVPNTSTTPGTAPVPPTAAPVSGDPNFIGPPSPTAPIAPSKVATMAQFAQLTPAQQKAYCASIAGTAPAAPAGGPAVAPVAASPTPTADIKNACAALLAGGTSAPTSPAMPGPDTVPAPAQAPHLKPGDAVPPLPTPAPQDFVKLSTQAQLSTFGLLNPDQQHALCASFGPSAGGGADGGLNNGLVECARQRGSSKEATLMLQSKCYQTNPGTSSSARALGMPASIANQCATILAGGSLSQTDLTDGGKAGGVVPSPDGAAKPPADPSFQSNLANGIAFGLFAGLVGSFFGGPLLMLAAALVVGISVFLVAKAINKPADPNAKPPSDSKPMDR